MSLEYGFAEAWDIPRVLYLSTHARAKKATKDTPIISDLAGKKRNQYKVEAGLKRLLKEFSEKHPYSIRLERFFRDKYSRIKPGDKKRIRALALKVIHALDGVQNVRRADISLTLQADNAGYTPNEVNQIIRSLHGGKLILSQKGPHSRVRIR